MSKDYTSFITPKKAKRANSVMKSPGRNGDFSFCITGYNLIAMQSQMKELKEVGPETELDSILQRMLSGSFGNRCPVWVYD